jgi:2-phosphosulfolactate phosphatase
VPAVKDSARITDRDPGGCFVAGVGADELDGLTRRLAAVLVNGALAVSTAGGSAALVVACLRNRRAAADFLAGALRADRHAAVTIVACGEHWSSVTEASGIRSSLEDWIGAGALAVALAEHGATLSPEARAAAAAFESAVRDGLGDTLRECVSGRELVTKGFPADVDLAAQLDVSDTVPLHDPRDGFFRSMGSERP